jgi:murein DD-endopeptidase MepM/ murein hydrolase activator NlpD
MFTILQRQQVAKRPTAPVPQRARTTGVRWSTRPLPPRRPDNDAYGRPGSALEALRVQVQVLRRSGGRGRDPGALPRSFLERQSVRRAPRPGAAERRRAEREQVRDEKRRAKQERQLRRASLLGQAPRARRERIVRPGGTPRWEQETRAAPGGASASARASARTAGAPLSERAAAAVGSPWFWAAILFVVLVAVAALAVVRGPGGRLAQDGDSILPVVSDVDQPLYETVIPDPVPVPASAAPAIKALTTTTYKTVPGDSVSRIAARFKLNVDTIVSWNGIKDARTLAAGTSLVIPSADGVRYTVRRGDTLQGIARASGIDLNAVLDANMLSSSVIKTGQSLFLPGARLSANERSRVLGTMFVYPLQGRLSSFFGVRPDPFTGVMGLHNGIDLVNKVGTAVGAAMAGTVRAAAFNFTYGNYVIIDHGNGYQTLYGHLTRSVVRKGTVVRQGQEIGELGSTGYSTGPHLHFSIFKNGEAVDPLKFLK